MVSRGKTSNKRKANSILGLGGPLGSPGQGTVCTGGAILMPKAWELVAVKGFKHGLAGGAPPKKAMKLKVRYDPGSPSKEVADVESGYNQGLPGEAAKKKEVQNQNMADRVKRTGRKTQKDIEKEKIEEMEERLLLTDDSVHGL